MAQYQYKCVHVPAVVDTSKNMHSIVIRQYEDVINDAATGGWELDHIDSVTSVQKPGCGSGNKEETVTFKLMIFRKLID